MWRKCHQLPLLWRRPRPGPRNMPGNLLWEARGSGTGVQALPRDVPGMHPWENMQRYLGASQGEARLYQATPAGSQLSEGRVSKQNWGNKSPYLKWSLSTSVHATEEGEGEVKPFHCGSCKLRQMRAPFAWSLPHVCTEHLGCAKHCPRWIQRLCCTVLLTLRTILWLRPFSLKLSPKKG